MRTWRMAHVGFTLAALMLVSRPGSAADLPPDLALVPADATAVATVRAGALLEKLGLDLGRGPLAAVREAEKLLGLKVTDVERATLVLRGPLPATPLWIVRMAKPFDRDQLCAALRAGGLEPQLQTDTRVLVTFSSLQRCRNDLCSEGDRTILFGNSELLTAALSAHLLAEPALAAALAEAKRHDLVAWVGAVPAAKPGPPTTSARADGPSALHISYKRQAPVARPVEVLGVPAPVGVEALTVTLDVGKETVVEARLSCADGESARRAEPLVQFGIEVLRGQALMLTVTAGMELLDPTQFGLPARDRPADRSAEPFLKVLRGAEECLQAANVRRQGKTVRVAVKTPTQGKQLGEAIQAIAEFEGTCWAQSCQRPPQHVPATGAAPAGSLPARRLVPVQAGQLIEPVNPPADPGGFQSVGVPGPLTPAAAGPVTFAVANVKKEAVLLFTEGEGGKLRFVCKVPAGDAVDLTSGPACRWIAVFAGAPAGTAFTVTEQGKVVLLR